MTKIGYGQSWTRNRQNSGSSSPINECCWETHIVHKSGSQPDCLLRCCIDATNVAKRLSLTVATCPWNGWNEMLVSQKYTTRQAAKHPNRTQKRVRNSCFSIFEIESASSAQSVKGAWRGTWEGKASQGGFKGTWQERTWEGSLKPLLKTSKTPCFSTHKKQKATCNRQQE